jgi:hypothetical protein
MQSWIDTSPTAPLHSDQFDRIPQCVVGHVAIQRGRGYVPVPHQFLDGPHPNPLGIEPRGEGSPTRM